MRISVVKPTGFGTVKAFTGFKNNTTRSWGRHGTSLFKLRMGTGGVSAWSMPWEHPFLANFMRPLLRSNSRSCTRTRSVERTGIRPLAWPDYPNRSIRQQGGRIAHAKFALWVDGGVGVLSGPDRDASPTTRSHCGFRNWAPPGFADFGEAYGREVARDTPGVNVTGSLPSPVMLGLPRYAWTPSRSTW
jgi:hypothetical protein